jgi:hypothetical protein
LAIVQGTEKEKGQVVNPAPVTSHQREAPFSSSLRLPDEGCFESDSAEKPSWYFVISIE